MISCCNSKSTAHSTFTLQAHYSTGQVAASFTSTVMEPTTRHEAGTCTPLSRAKSCRSILLIVLQMLFGLCMHLQLDYHFPAIIDEDVLRYEIVKKNGKKGYVSLITNYGLLNLELHCDMVSGAKVPHVLSKEKLFQRFDFSKKR